MIPIVSYDEVSREKHFFEVIEALHELGFEDGVEVEEGDEAVLGVPANVDDFARFLEQGRRQHAKWKMGFDDSVKRNIGIGQTSALTKSVKN